jgi:hypothetical protein
MTSFSNPATQQAVNNLGGTTGGSMTKDYFFAYGLLLSAVAAAAQGVQGQLQIDAGVNFLCRQVACTAKLTQNAANTPTGTAQGAKILRWGEATPAANSALLGIGLHHFTVTFSSPNRPWSNIPIPLDLLTGDTNQPFWLPTAVFCAGNETISASVNSFAPALTGVATPTVDIFFAFLGTKQSK